MTWREGVGGVGSIRGILNNSQWFSQLFLLQMAKQSGFCLFTKKKEKEKVVFVFFKTENKSLCPVGLLLKINK